MTSKPEVRIGAARLPVLRRVDVALMGGSCAAVATAAACARAGADVLLVEPRTYLGREFAATLRPWVVLHADTVRCFWHDLLQRMDLPWLEGAEIALKLDHLKLALEEICLDAGVGLLYASQTVEVVKDAGQVAGVVIGNKSGRQVVEARAIVDATEGRILGRLAGVPQPAARHIGRYRRTLEFDGLRDDPGTELAVPPEIGVAGDRVRIHWGYRGPQHVFVELAFDAPAVSDFEGAMAREIEARHLSMRLAAHLIGAVAAFREATLASASLELWGPEATAGDLDVDPCAGPISGLWFLDERANPGDPVEVARMGEELVAPIVAWLRRGSGRRRLGPEAVSSRSMDALEVPADTLTLGEFQSPDVRRDYERRPVPGGSVPVLGRCEVLVVGGGASGASAAIVAAREGADTILLEMNAGLGGTGTLAGVHSYWYGRHAGFSLEVRRLTDEVQRPLGHTKATWNIEAKMYALLRAAEAAGAQVCFNTVTIGALLDGSRVRGVLVATPWGPRAVLAEVVIDATGDGDVAAFAGASFEYGSTLDHNTMWYSLGQFTTPGRTRNNFTSMVDVSNVEDYTRAILAGRRRGSDVHDHSVYLAPRESRHIEGSITMTHTDQLRRRRWTDVVNIHYSNHDVKGCSTSPWVRVGLIPPNLEIEVPYRALLPRGLDGILVVGKAISATHDALPAVRMQADMETLGAVAALAGVEAVAARVAPHEIDVRVLQERLAADGVLPLSVLSRSVDGPARSREDLDRLVDALAGDAPLYSYSDMEMGELFEETIPFVEICTVGPDIIPHLEAALPGAAGLRRQHLAQALAMYGCPSAVPALLDCLGQHLGDAGLPARENQIRHANYPPDQGAMPDAVYLLYSLGMTRDPRAIPVWEEIVDRVDGTAEDVRDRRKGTFYYVEAICWGAGELRDPRAVPLLKRLHARPALHGNLCTSGFQPDHFKEREAMMELSIGRALARCGSHLGLEILIAYLNDVRALLAAGAHSHLVDITGTDNGGDSCAWTAWLEETTRVEEPDFAHSSRMERDSSPWVV